MADAETTVTYNLDLYDENEAQECAEAAAEARYFGAYENYQESLNDSSAEYHYELENGGYDDGGAW